jgi:endonuclease/exonuclease/phosphatase family metal-dependent hydrolase
MRLPPDSSMDQVICGGFVLPRVRLWPRDSIRVVDWNIERGRHLAGIIEFLKKCKADLIFLQEVDLNARRTHHLDVAREIAQSLQLNFVFGKEFEELTQGSRHSPGYQGQATLSPWPIKNARLIRFRRQTTFWEPHWYLPRIEPFQERLGGRIALAADIEVSGQVLTTYNLHLESKENDALRVSQLDEVLAEVGSRNRNQSTLIAGDWNLNAGEGQAVIALRKAGFRDAVGLPHLCTRPARGLFDQGRSIDGIFLSGPLQSSDGQVHGQVRVSDHFPISFVLSLTS